MITAGGDDRVTTPGRLIRKLKLDELPQLWSVVRGDMTLFGPRPEDPSFVDVSDSDWQEILRMAPGMAGLTQLVFGDLEIELLRDGEDVEQTYRTRILPVKMELDRWYVKHASPRTDALVAIGLIQRVLSARRSRAVDNYVRSRVPSAAAALSELQAVAA
jgi:lipopolysaccharide/colanic/teichoic acid biosynthesis glycosyltransferase